MENLGLKPYWLSWWCDEDDYGKWELHSPWWVTGEDPEGRLSICAAVWAGSHESAQGIIHDCYDEPPSELDWRSVEQKPPEFDPFTDRFPRRDWMKWGVEFDPLTGAERDQ